MFNINRHFINSNVIHEYLVVNGPSKIFVNKNPNEKTVIIEGNFLFRDVFDLQFTFNRIPKTSINQFLSQVKAYLHWEKFRLKFCRETVRLRGFWLCCYHSWQDFKWNPLILMFLLLYKPKSSTRLNLYKPIVSLPTR